MIGSALKAIILVGAIFILLLVDRILIETTMDSLVLPYLALLIIIVISGLCVWVLWRDRIIKIEGLVIYLVYSLILGETLFVPIFLLYLYIVGKFANH